ncbi:DMT family transporter [Candidatus Woesebacteria bacterium]|nr:DMT family transporter [Candidatus Woesebacteria bacterium]
MNSHRLRAYFELFLTTLLWGIATPVIKFTLAGFTPLLFLTYRFGISSVVAISIEARNGFKFLKNKNTLLFLIVYGFLVSTVTLGLLFLGFDKTTAIDGTLITGTAPIFITIFGSIVLKEHVTLREKVGIVIAFVGTLITIIEPILKFNDGHGALEGNILVLMSVLVGAFTTIMTKKLLRENVSPITISNVSFIVGFLSLLPITLKYYSPAILISTLTGSSWPYILGLLYMALISGNLSYWLSNKAMKTIEVGEASVFTYLTPLFTTPLAVIWLHEKITIPFIIGAIVITIGVVIAEAKKSRAKI